MMKRLLSVGVLAVAQLTAAAPDPLITPRAELQVQPRDTDPALLGWLSTSGASELSDPQSCDFPATLSKSGSYAQCCAPSSSCNFFTSCRAGTVFAASTSVFCDQGFCNTGLIVSTTDAKSGVSYLGCWATSLGKSPFALVQHPGSANIATPTATASLSGDSTAAASSAAASETESKTAISTTGGRATGSAAATSSKGAAVSSVVHLSLSGIFALIATFLGLL